MIKGKWGIILLFSTVSIMLSGTLFAPLAFAQEAIEEKQPVAEFLGVDETNPFFNFWTKLFSSWGETIAVNSVGVLSAIIVLGIGYFIGRAVEFALRKFLKKLFSNKLLVEKGGIKAGETYEKAGWGQISDLIPMTAKWFAWIYAFVIAIDLLGFTEASAWLGVLWTYIPNIIAFIILIVVGIIGTRVILQWMAKFNSDLFGDDGSMPMVKTLVTVIIYALIFGIGITQLGVGEEIIPILYWVIIAGIMGLLIAGGTGFREVFRSWSYGEGLKHSGLGNGDQIKYEGKEGEVTHIGITHTTVKVKEEVFLVPNTELHEHKIQILKKAKKE
jgi:hypothetical protein